MPAYKMHMLALVRTVFNNQSYTLGGGDVISSKKCSNNTGPISNYFRAIIVWRSTQEKLSINYTNLLLHFMTHIITTKCLPWFTMYNFAHSKQHLIVCNYLNLLTLKRLLLMHKPLWRQGTGSYFTTIGCFLIVNLQPTWIRVMKIIELAIWSNNLATETIRPNPTRFLFIRCTERHNLQNWSTHEKGTIASDCGYCC